MATATNGEVWYERSVKVADYENKKFGARISYVLDAGDDAEAVYDLFSRQVVRKVEEALGLRKPELPSVKLGANTPVSGGGGSGSAAQPIMVSVAPANETFTVKAKVVLEPTPLEQAIADTPKPKGKPGRPKGSGKKAVEDVPADEPEVREAKFQEMVKNTPEPEPGDEIDHPGFSGPAITDVDLGQAARRAAEKLGGASKVKDFIQAFFNEPCPTGVWKLLNIPVERRAEFITKLEAYEIIE